MIDNPSGAPDDLRVQRQDAVLHLTIQRDVRHGSSA